LSAPPGENLKNQEPNPNNQIRRTKFQEPNPKLGRFGLGIWFLEFGSSLLGYIENELPQPQVLLALGLLMLKPRRLRSSWKSTVTLSRYIKLRLSTTTGTP